MSIRKCCRINLFKRTNAMFKIYAFCGVFLLCLCCAVSSVQAKVYIDIFNPSSRSLPIVITPFRSSGDFDREGIGSKAAQVIAADLDFSGVFKSLDSSAAGGPLVDGEKIKWDMVSMLGAEAIIVGSVKLSSGSAVFELRLYDAVQQRQMVGKQYDGRAEDYREIAHRFANEVFKNMTGAKGVFDTKIAYVRSELPNKDIAIADYDGANGHMLTNYHSLTIGPAWSHDGRQLAFTSYKDGNPNCYIQGVDLYRGTARGAAKLVSRKKGVNITPDWSPDDERIALTLNLNNGNSEIYIQTLATGALERVTFDPATDVSPSWSPDGRMLTFVSDRSGGPQIYTVDLAAGRFKRISFNESSYNTSPAWSPRGDRIAYVGLVGGKYNIFITSTDGQYQQQITSGQGNNEEPAWSPDGRFLALSSSRAGQKEIYIMRADGTGAKRITFEKGNKTEPAWAPGLTN